MITKQQEKLYAKYNTYESEPIAPDPLLRNISEAALIAFFRCNSCYTCKWREEVIEKDTNPDHDIHFCAKMHEKVNLIDMVSYLGFSKEGREADVWPSFKKGGSDE